MINLRMEQAAHNHIKDYVIRHGYQHSTNDVIDTILWSFRSLDDYVITYMAGHADGHLEIHHKNKRIWQSTTRSGIFTFDASHPIPLELVDLLEISLPCQISTSMTETAFEDLEEPF
ncbi:MAG: hypothetical protein WC284_17710 [Candidimonas sp.]